MAVSITICNLALGELRAAPIADIAEDSIEARECARYYPQALAVLLALHEWSFANRRASLAARATNDRPNEWAYAYALPTDCATPLRVGSDTSAPAGWRYEDRVVPGWWANWIVENGTLYSQIPDAVLEYSASAVDDASMPPLFVDALTFALAARLATPIANDRKLKGELLQQAEIAAQRAVADDRNRQPQRDTEGPDEVGMARAGGFPGNGPGGC